MSKYIYISCSIYDSIRIYLTVKQFLFLLRRYNAYILTLEYNLDISLSLN